MKLETQREDLSNRTDMRDDKSEAQKEDSPILATRYKNEQEDQPRKSRPTKIRKAESRILQEVHTPKAKSRTQQTVLGPERRLIKKSVFQQVGLHPVRKEELVRKTCF